MKSSFDVQYWLHMGEVDALSPQPITARTRNRSWYFEPVSFSSFNHPIETIVSRIEANQADLTLRYHDWWDTGFALARELGESGRTFYHRISRFNARYSPDRCNRQFDSCLKGKGSSMAVNTFFHLVKEAGFDAPWRATNLRVIWKEKLIPPTDLFAEDDFLEDQPIEEQSIEVQSTEVEAIGEQPIEVEPMKEQSTEEQSTAVEPITDQPMEDIGPENQPTTDQPTEDEANEEQPAEGEPIAEGPDNEELVFNTPPLPPDIYPQLPEILRETCLLFPQGIDQDVFLISSMTVLSACLPNIEGTYFDESYSAHLFTFITAPAGSGKGRMNWAKHFGFGIHDHLTEKSDKERKAFERNLEKYHNSTRAQKLMVEKPKEPPHKMFFIPANTSASAFIQSLADNDFRAVIFEAEADTLANTFKKDWGNFSDVVRKGFHHESTSLFRKKDNTFIEIKNPHVALGLGGTPKQVHRLMPDAENGLFSRFLFYAFEDEGEFNHPFHSKMPVNYKTFMKEKGDQIFELYHQLNQLPQPIEFKLTEEQGNRFTALFGTMLKRDQLLIGRNFNANIKRLGLITFRIAMTLTGLRLLENTQLVTPQLVTPQLVTPSHLLSKTPNYQLTEPRGLGENSLQLRDNILLCSDCDYETAITIAATLEKHAIAVYQTLPNNDLKGKSLAFYEKLPQQFDRQCYLKVAAELGIQPKTAEKYIGQFMPKLLHHEYNLYTKILK